MEETGGVLIKGTREGLTIQVSPDFTFDELLSNLKEKFQGNVSFFQNAELVLDLGLRPFQENEFRQLRELLDSSGIKLKGILSDNPVTKLMAQSDGITLLGDRSIINSRVPVPHPVKLERLRGDHELKRSSRQIKTEARNGYSLFLRKTIRAGQKIHCVGDVTILGDVNPGAELVATGNIAVFGALRGVAHAGAEGKRDAVVVALELLPTQLRIADCIARAPERLAEASSFPELARIAEEQIVIEPYVKV